MPKGYLSLVLHAHLPFVRHPENEDFLEERWLYEAITETYIPLIQMLDRLQEENIPYPLTISLSPPLLSMLSDELLQRRYLRHLDKLLELIDKELVRTKNTIYYEVTLMYQEKLNEAKFTFSQKYNSNLIEAFKKHQDYGSLNIITCGATHGFLPLLFLQPETVKAQIGIAVDTHLKYLGKRPTGIWLPECAYTPGIDEILNEFGIEYFFVDTHGIMFASKRPKYGIHAPLACPSGVLAFARDNQSSKQVWSSNEGYPGDFYYREYYRDLGFDLDYDYIKSYIHPDGIRINTGIKYHRITGKSNYKEVYQPQIAKERAFTHADNFIYNRTMQIENLSHHMDRPPLIISPYDAELFGHWWYEGPIWLEYLFRKIHFNQKTIELITPPEYIKRYPKNQIAVPCSSTWGRNGYNEVWLAPENHWIYRHLHMAGNKINELVTYYPESTGILKRALQQACRELLLAQSSDWAFILNTNTMTEYAIRRTKTHLDNFLKLYQQIKSQNIDHQYLDSLEKQNNIFPNLNYLYYHKDAKKGLLNA